MFCPGCGLNEDRAVQYCRACGTDLGLVRGTMTKSEAQAASVTSAREEIARALANRIQQGEWWQTSTLVTQMSKLFESSAERRERWLHAGEEARLRRIRAGVITAAAGLGEMIFLALLSTAKPDLLLLAGPGLIAFLIGLGILINGLVFTTHRRLAAINERNQKEESELNRLIGDMNHRQDRRELTTGGMKSTPPAMPASVTEQTTRHLAEDDPRG